MRRQCPQSVCSVLVSTDPGDLLLELVLQCLGAGVQLGPLLGDQLGQLLDL